MFCVILYSVFFVENLFTSYVSYKFTVTKKFLFYKIIFHVHVYDLVFKSTFVFFIQSNSYSVLNIELYFARNACYWSTTVIASISKDTNMMI